MEQRASFRHVDDGRAMEEQCAAIPFQAARMSMCAALVSRVSGRAFWSRWMWVVRKLALRDADHAPPLTTACASPGRP